MKSYKELLKTDTYWITKIQNDLYNAVEDYLKENKMTRKAFAEQLGVSKGYISQVLNGDFNHKLPKLVELAIAIGKAPVFELENLEYVAEQEAKGMVRRKAHYVSSSPIVWRVQAGSMSTKELSGPLCDDAVLSGESIMTDSKVGGFQGSRVYYNYNGEQRPVA